MGVDLHLGFRKHRSDMCHRGTGDLQEGDGSSEGGAGTVGDPVPSLRHGLCQPPRSERAEASVLGSGPTSRLHCLLWPPSWSTEKAGEAGLGSS